MACGCGVLISDQTGVGEVLLILHRVVSVLYLPESHSGGLSGYGGGYSTINGQASNQRDGQPGTGLLQLPSKPLGIYQEILEGPGL